MRAVWSADKYYVDVVELITYAWSKLTSLNYESNGKLNEN